MSWASMLLLTWASSSGVFFSTRMQQVVPLVLGVLALVFMTMSVRKRQQQLRRSANEPITERPLPIRMELRRDMDALMVELQELSRKISADIDTRFAKLEAVIRDADRRIAVLHRLARDTHPEGVAALKSGVNPDAGPDSRHTVVYELSDAGFSPVDIARELGKTPGEVELILNLRRKTSSSTLTGDGRRSDSDKLA